MGSRNGSRAPCRDAGCRRQRLQLPIPQRKLPPPSRVQLRVPQRKLPPPIGDPSAWKASDRATSEFWRRPLATGSPRMHAKPPQSIKLPGAKGAIRTQSMLSGARAFVVRRRGIASGGELHQTRLCGHRFGRLSQSEDARFNLPDYTRSANEHSKAPSNFSRAMGAAAKGIRGAA